MAPDPFASFELSKWYLDAVSESGDVFIGYRANLRWRRLAVAYASSLAGGALVPGTRSSVGPGAEPEFFEGALAWAEPKLGVEGTWRDGAAPGISRVLYESPAGSVVWRCLMPTARADVREGCRVLHGLGYAEHLSMTVPPWRLPIDTLRWGRFLSPGRSVVWIDWEREKTPRRTWIFMDGREVRGEVSEEDVFFEGGELRLPARERLTLRRGRLSHLLRNLRGTLRTSPLAPALGAHETKWRTRGCLRLDGSPPEGGWAIHEVVRMTA